MVRLKLQLNYCKSILCPLKPKSSNATTLCVCVLVFVRVCVCLG